MNKWVGESFPVIYPLKLGPRENGVSRIAARPMVGIGHVQGDLIIRANRTELRNHAVRKPRFLAIISVGCIAFAGVSGAHGQQAPRRIALKSGESTELRNYYFVQHCQSIVIGKPVLDVLEGPEELTVSLKEGMKVPQKCTKPVPGGTVVATAKDVKAPKEAKLTIRLKFNTKVGERQSSNTYSVSLFP